MHCIIKNRLMGKTTELINMVRDNYKGILVVYNDDIKNRFRNKFPDIAPRILSLNDIKQRLVEEDHDYYLDDADILLQDLFGSKLKGVTFNTNKKEG